jgi:hypothetical protein
VFNKIFAELARRDGKPERILIHATHLEAHRTAASLQKHLKVSLECRHAEACASEICEDARRF